MATILLADDDPVMRELALAKLQDAGHRVVVAENGDDALRRLRGLSEKPELVISDIEMPVMDGFALTRAIRSDDRLRETPVILITASDHADAVDRSFAEGATSFLSKPINWTLFNQSVMFVLRASRNQQNLRRARDQAEAGAMFKDTLMSVMSHELRTPLNAIIGFGQLLSEQLKQRGDSVHQEYADYIVDGGKRLLNSVSDMLLASDARSGPLSLNECETTVAEIIEGAQLLAASSGHGARPQITVRLQDPALEIACDRGLLTRAVAKLIDNAIKFSDGAPKIVIASAANKRGELAILVKDDGPGIPGEILEKAGAPFTQSDMSLRRSKEGLGLGIPMTKAIAAAHGAAFRIDSAPGGGARAMIVLPASRVLQPGGRRVSRSVA